MILNHMTVEDLSASIFKQNSVRRSALEEKECFRINRLSGEEVFSE